MPMKKVILAVCVAATPALAGSPESPWDRPTLTPPVAPPTLTVRKCGEDFERITGWLWLRVKTGETITLSKRKWIERRCRSVKKPQEPVDKPQEECRRVEREGETPRFVTVCE